MKIKKNGKVINLTESDLKRIINHTLNGEKNVGGTTVDVDREGKILINKQGKNYKYLLEAYKYFMWWDIVVSSISIVTNIINYFQPKTGELKNSSLNPEDIAMIKNNVGKEVINLGETKNGEVLRLTRIS